MSPEAIVYFLSGSRVRHTTKWAPSLASSAFSSWCYLANEVENCLPFWNAICAPEINEIVPQPSRASGYSRFFFSHSGFLGEDSCAFASLFGPLQNLRKNKSATISPGDGQWEERIAEFLLSFLTLKTGFCSQDMFLNSNFLFGIYNETRECWHCSHGFIKTWKKQQIGDIPSYKFNTLANKKFLRRRDFILFYVKKSPQIIDNPRKIKLDKRMGTREKWWSCKIKRPLTKWWSCIYLIYDHIGVDEKSKSWLRYSSKSGYLSQTP